MSTVQVGRDFTLYWATGSDMGALYKKTFSSGTAIGLVNNLSYTVEEGTEVYHGAGKREAWGIKAGAKDVTVHLEGLWVDSGIQKFFLNEIKSSGNLTSFVLGASGTDKSITFSGCRLGTFDANIDADGWATETIDLLAIMIG